MCIRDSWEGVADTFTLLDDFVRDLEAAKNIHAAGELRALALSLIHILHELADQENADLVLICAHGYSGELRWPYGGLAAGFVAYGSSPLLLFQDAPAKEIAPTPAEVAAQTYGRR